MAEQKRKRDDQRRTGQLSSVQVMFAAILAVGLLLAINFSSRIAAGQPLQETYDQVSQEVEDLRAEQADLVVERDYVRSDAYVERWARDEGKMAREGEVLVIPVPAGVSAEPTPSFQVDVPFETSPPEPESWQVWWSLFFDTDPPEF
jgi:cell division protein FtsB